MIEFYYLLTVLISFIPAIQGIVLKRVNVPFTYNFFINIGITCICSFIYLMYIEKSFNLVEIFNYDSILISILNVIQAFLKNLGFVYCPVSIAGALLSLYSVFLVFFNRIVNNLKVNILQIISLLISVIGVFIVSFNRINLDNKSFYGILLITIGQIICALNFALMDYYKLKNKDASSIMNANKISFINAYIGFILVGLFIFLQNVLSKNSLKSLPIVLQNTYFDLKSILYIIFIYFILRYCGFVATFMAYDNLSSSVFGILNNLPVVISILMGYYILNEKITYKKIIGATIIMVGIIGEVYAKSLTSLTKY